ncbi:sulfatase-like hydrolase/transferase [Parasphingorhabdus sp.]|uniref:sulfatase-like hydrolase/transferase n=1 Tax=Parasphingorhabdus sp. TaxID=2709688 RepID=UPI003267ED04
MMRNIWKLLLILLSLLLGGWEVVRRIEMLSTPEVQLTGLVAYAVLFITCLISAIGAAFIVRPSLRWLLAILLASGSWLVDGYQWVVGDFMAYDAFVTMMQSAGDLGSAFQQQWPVMLLAATKAGLLLVGVGLRPMEQGHWLTRLSALISLPVILALTVLLFFRGGEGGSGLPSSHSGLSFTLLQGYELVVTSDAERETVALPPLTAAPKRDIVLIIDESIAGAYLDINDEHGVYSGLAGSPKLASIHNFGLAVSITHCSVGSNLSMRFGGTRENYQEAARTMPSIWAYAAEAGLQTVYLDAQRTGRAYQNQMDDEERQLIGQWVQFADVPVVDRDQAVALQLAELLNDDQPQFILVNKVGAHFPVNDKYPDSHKWFTPALPRGSFADVTDMAVPDELDGAAGNWRLYRNSYRNTLTWSVGKFFDRLFAGAQLSNATIIYTSDHGQHLHENPDNGTATHCTPNPAIEEAVVPLVVINGPDAEQTTWRTAAEAGHDRMSHYRIFPTLLSLMGFQQSDILPVYGPDLLSGEADPFTFNVRYNARLGSSPVWKHVPLENVARPPVGDYQKNQTDR